MPDIKLNMQTKKAIRQLGRKGNLLQIVAAETVNEAAEGLDKRYKGKLERKQRLRNKRFTLGAIKTFKATPVRKSGEPRQLGKINAIVGVRKMKAGKEHYLAKLERGVVNRGTSKTMNKAPVPLTVGRTSQNINKPIAAANRFTKGDTQTLKAGGRPFGVEGDGFKKGKQRFAVLSAYKRGKSGLTGDLKKPFFFMNKKDEPGIFKFIKNEFHKIRSLDKSVTRTQKSPNFKNAVKATKPADIKRNFVKKAQNRLKK